MASPQIRLVGESQGNAAGQKPAPVLRVDTSFARGGDYGAGFEFLDDDGRYGQSGGGSGHDGDGDGDGEEDSNTESGDKRGRRRSRFMEGVKKAWPGRSRSRGSQASDGSALSPSPSVLSSAGGSSPVPTPTTPGFRQSFLSAVSHRRAPAADDTTRKLTYDEWLAEAEAAVAQFAVAGFAWEPPTRVSLDALQEAVALHEAGDVNEATARFRALAARPDAPPLAHVLHGLSLRNGWGCPADAAAAHASFQRAALSATRVGTAAAHGEMAVALYELGNCARHGAGCPRDDAAGRRFYELAANLGDVDAMLCAADVCLKGVGGPKSKHQAARYYRMAEDLGRVEVGNSWIWKDKYD